ncbi:MAG: tetratricopeptide repeat protein [Chloroflexota bacterium]|nr:tetratricopeptide repeat protein [Chloroflexota bacterium]
MRTKIYVVSLSNDERQALHALIHGRPGIAHALNALATAVADQHDYVRAEAWFTESLVLRRELGNRHDTAVTLSNLAIVARLQGDFATRDDAWPGEGGPATSQWRHRRTGDHFPVTSGKWPETRVILPAPCPSLKRVSPIAAC